MQYTVRKGVTKERPPVQKSKAKDDEDEAPPSKRSK